MGIPVKLQVFEGPLDLLLHLIDKNKIDIYDIPIVEITNQYMDYIRAMERAGIDTIVEIGPGRTLTSFVKKTAPSVRTYNIDTAGDFVKVTAALKGEAL